MRSESISVGDGEGRRGKGKRKKVSESRGETDRLHHKGCLSLTSSHSVQEANNQCFGTGGHTLTHTHINLQGTLCVFDGGEDVLVVCVLQESVCLKCRARQES